jgi:carboxymethylenebutenolidase
MSGINEYLTGEVVVDYADGLVDRREALRRLGLLGVAAGVAMTMLAACDLSDPPPVTPGPAGGASTGGSPPPAPGEAVTFAGAQGRELRGSWAAPASPKGAVLIIHENRGLTDHFKALPTRLAASGYAALAIDLLSVEGGTDGFADPAQATAALNAAPPERFLADMRSGLDELARRAPDTKAAVMGFCFGGGQTWALLAAGEPRLYAAAPFYGPAPDGADFSGSPNAAVLGVYAELDSRVNASRDGAAAALARAGLIHEIVTFPGANHAFFNDTGARYDPAAATAAYTRLIAWYDRYLA